MTDYLGPYELNTIITGDARELAEAIPDESVSLMLTDPPYWVNFKYGNGQRDSQMDYINPAWLVNESSRIAKVSLITPGIVNLYDYPRPNWVMAWDKQNSMKRYQWGFAHFEPILCYGDPNLSQAKMRPDVYKAPIVVENSNIGACPKPLKLFRELIETFTEPNEVVVDFFVGSGTTAIACKKLGRRYLAFEIDPGTADLARERVANTQPPLFVEMPQQIEMFA